MCPCRLFPRREGILGIGNLVVFLFRQFITYCNKCKLSSYPITLAEVHVKLKKDLNGSLGSRQFLYVMEKNEKFCIVNERI